MPIHAPARQLISPNFIEPRKIVTRAQRSGFMSLFSGEGPRVTLEEKTLKVYVPLLDITNMARSGQTRANLMDTVSLRASFIGAPTYQLQMRADYSREDIVGASAWDIPLPASYKVGMFQGIFQATRDFALSGPNPQNGEGLLETQNAIRTAFPKDKNGATSLLEYNPGEFMQNALNQITSILTRTNLIGSGADANEGGEAVKMCWLMPQRVLGWMQRAVVPLQDYQLPGAGVATVFRSITEICKASNVNIVMKPDDKLAGAGEPDADGKATDATILAVPELPKSGNVNRSFDTNIFGDDFTPENFDINVIYADRELPSTATAPIDAELTDYIAWMRITPGWCMRPEAMTIISILAGPPVTGVLPPELGQGGAIMAA